MTFQVLVVDNVRGKYRIHAYHHRGWGKLAISGECSRGEWTLGDYIGERFGRGWDVIGAWFGIKIDYLI
jgi:hypothetical protein